MSRRDWPAAGELVSPESISAAAALLDGVAVATPVLDASHWAGGPLGLKLENLQPTGAFKLRGATVAVARLDAATRSAGVVTHSSGNHAQALAWAARAAGVPATIVIPHGAAAGKVAATEALGARVLRVDAADRAATADRVLAETGGALVPPYDHPDVIAGQGTVGLEIGEAAPDVEVVLVPVSGGGLISGIAAALARRGVRIVGVEPELAADAAESLRTGVLTAWPPEQVARTAADGLRVTRLGALPWQHVRTLVHDIITVTEDEIADAARCLALRARVVAEPSGAVSTAAWLHHRAELPPGRTVAVVSGGNADPGWLAAVLSPGRCERVTECAEHGGNEQDGQVMEVRPGGRRRIDRVLAAGFATDLPQLSMVELRSRRDEAAQEETDLSYVRRLLHARIDIVRAEQRRRDEGGSASVITELARILAINAVGPTGSGRHHTLEPSRAEAHRRHVEALVSDSDLSDVVSLSEEQLDGALIAYLAEEESISYCRREVQLVMDRLNAEIGSRYAQGSASVDDLLAGEGGQQP